MPAKKAKRAPARAAAPAAGLSALPPEIAELAATLGVFHDAAVITRDRWQGGGVELMLANDKFAELTGYAAAAVPGQNTRMLHGPRTDLLAPGAATAGRLALGEGWLYRKDGTEFYAGWSFSPLLIRGEPSGCLVGLYRDLTETRRLREALVLSQKLTTVGLLAGGVTHDFNNLLSVINGYCEILATKLAAVPAAQKDLQEIHRAGLKASALTRQILEFSRRREREVKVVNFNTLVREIAEIIRRMAGEEIVVELRLASDLGNVRIDPTQFQQVLLNLCINARDAMVRGGKLTIRTFNHRVRGPADRRAPEMADGPYAAMQVTDTGPGIPAAEQKSIFEPFFTTKPQGTGLGLSTALGIVRENNGHLLVRSSPGDTNFELFLPETAEPEQISVTKLGTLPAMRGTEKVLIIEADEVLRKMIAGILATDGYQVTSAANPEEAAALLARTGLQPELLLAPGGTKAGTALVRRMRATLPRLRVISTSAAPPTALLPDFPAGTLVHLPKPFALSTLLLKARGLLDMAVN
jgi:two-component system cell cycle sensor histidine kinase/response regulator CckA